MLSRTRTYFWLLLAMLLLLPPSIVMIKYLDEIIIMLMLVLVGLDLLATGDWRRYKGLLICVGVMAFYAVYSLVIGSNVAVAIASDFFIQLKPFISFFVAYSVGLRLTPQMRKILKVASILPVILAVSLLAVSKHHTSVYLGHVAYAGAICFMSSMVYLYCSIQDNGTLKKNDMFVVVLILTGGLLCTRSKYYGEFVMVLYFLYLYKPGAMKNIRMSQVLALVFAIVVALLVTWRKIDYYFVSGASGEVGNLDEKTLMTFARPVLYVTAVMILMKYWAFGSGLASFATNASAVYYSPTYYEFDIAQVWGLSETVPEFICDVFYAELAQFGFVGIALFVLFWRYVWRHLQMVLHTQGRYMFAIGASLVMFNAIEAVGSTMFVQGFGELSMMLLGMVCAGYRCVGKEERKAILMQSYPDEKQVLEYNLKNKNT